MATEKIPLVSVIIPMHNAAKFIPQTLENLLYQTIKNFEVVVVDDCSTDSSVEVVQSFSGKFGDRLNVIKLPKNTGAPGLPRNVGINFARGKYIAFLDADDLLTETALEELSTLAEQYQAEVVHTDTLFLLFDKKNSANTLAELLTSCELVIYQNKMLSLTDTPIFETTDLAQRLLNWMNYAYNWESVTMFCKRNFLLANQIYFPKLTNNEDMLFSFRILCLAEKFLRVPNVTYLYRQRDESVSHKQFKESAAHFHKWLRVLIDGFNEFEDFMASVDFFVEKPDYRYAVGDFFFNEIAKQFISSYEHKPPFEVAPFVKKEFQSDAALSAYLFNTVNTQWLRIVQLEQELAKFQQQ